MDLTLTLVSELSILVKNQLAGLMIGIPICIKKRREHLSYTITTVEKMHSFLWVILVTSQSIRFSEKCLEMLRNERFSAGLIALQR